MTWGPTDRRTRLLGFGLGTLFGAYFALYAITILGRRETYRFPDFFALWADGRLLASHPAADLYNPEILPAWQMALGMPEPGNTPFPYPPIFMPVVRLLGLPPYNVGYAVFMAVTLGLYLVALATPRPRAPLLLMAFVAPTTIITLVAGQTGFLAGGLMLGGLRLARARPLVGGVLLGLLAFKPQFGLLVPFALAAASAWRCIAAAVATVLLLALATSAGFGWHIWADWVAYMPNFSARFDRESDQLLYLMPTLTGSLRAFGLSPAATRLPQLGLAMLSAVWVWRACREGLGPRALLVLATATFLATPYAFVYDLPLLTGAALLFARERLDARRGLSTGEVAVLTLALVFPAVLVHAGAALPIGVACLLLLAAVLIADPPTKDAARP
jgi:hypothetical protein